MANADEFVMPQHPQSSPQTAGRHVVHKPVIPQELLQQIRSPPQHIHRRVQSLSLTKEEEVEETFHNLEDDGFGFKQT